VRPRDAAFRIEVKRAYGFRCAICGTSLQGPKGHYEVQSAHIYPKSEDGSDDLRNGLCVCRMHHWALDVGWVSLSDDHTVLVRPGLPESVDYVVFDETAILGPLALQTLVHDELLHGIVQALFRKRLF